MHKDNTEIVSFKLNQVLFTALVFGFFGCVLELYLLKHYESILQSIPLVCIGLAIACLLILRYKLNKNLLRTFNFLMISIACSGILGAFLHLRANYEFEKEMRPSASAFDVFSESFSGALPALAPGSMVILALIGYSYSILLKKHNEKD